MRQAIASICVCWAAWCGAVGQNTAPLAFGMTPEQASTALGVPLVRYSGRHGSEIYLAIRPAVVPGFYPVDNAFALQFRRHRLTGWKQDYNLRRPWPF